MSMLLKSRRGPDFGYGCGYGYGRIEKGSSHPAFEFDWTYAVQRAKLPPPHPLILEIHSVPTNNPPRHPHRRGVDAQPPY